MWSAVKGFFGKKQQEPKVEEPIPVPLKQQEQSQIQTEEKPEQDPVKIAKRKEFLQRERQRFGGYVDVQSSYRSSEYVTIKNIRSYFNPDDKKETVASICQQYKQFTGEELTLKNQYIQITPDMPLSVLAQDMSYKETVQEVLNMNQEIKQIQRQELKIQEEMKQLDQKQQVHKSQKINESQEQKIKKNKEKQEKQEKYQKIAQKKKKIQKMNKKKQEIFLKNKQKIDKVKEIAKQGQKIKEQINQQRIISNIPNLNQNRMIQPILPLEQAVNLQNRDLNSFICSVSLQNTPKSPLTFEMNITQDTKLISIISKAQNQIDFRDCSWEIRNQQSHVYQHSTYRKTFSQLNTKYKRLTLTLLKNNYFRGNTQIHFALGNQTQMLSTFKQGSKVLSYQKGTTKLISSQLKQIKTSHHIKTLIKIQARCNQTVRTLQCTLQTLVLTEMYPQWIPVSKIFVGAGLLGLDPSGTQLAIYQVVQLLKIQNIKQDEQMYEISVYPEHNFFANGILVHNNTPLSIKVQYLNGKPQKAPNQVFYQIYHKISDIFIELIFGKCDVMLGDVKLNKQMTFGDYQIKQFNRLFVVYPELNNQKEHGIVSQWKQESFNYKYSDQKTNSKKMEKYRKHFMGITNGRIVSIQKIQSDLKKKKQALQNYTSRRMNFLIQDQEQQNPVQIQNSQSQSQNDVRNTQKSEETQKKQLFRQHGQIDVKNVIVARRAYFERYFYIQNDRQRYLPFQKHVYDKYRNQIAGKDRQQFQIIYNQFIKKAKFDKNKSKQEQLHQFRSHLLARYKYTDEDIYAPLNGFLRKAVKQIEERQLWFPITGWIWDSLHQLPNYRGITYRGIQNLKLRTILGRDQDQPQKQFVVFTSFTSTSTQSKTAKEFASKQGVFLTLELTNGKDISQFSKFDQKQVLIPHNTYFYIKQFNQNSKPYQTATLIEIPMPVTDSPYLLFWVDDKPYNNDFLIEKRLKPKGIEVMQIISTKIMQFIINNFFFSLKMMNKKIVIVSDMGRHEYEKGCTRVSDEKDEKSKKKLQKDEFNVRAGVDLFQKIYKTYGLSNRPIFYVGDAEESKKHIRQSEILSKKQSQWKVFDEQDPVVDAILSQFGINQ